MCMRMCDSVRKGEKGDDDDVMNWFLLAATLETHSALARQWADSQPSDREAATAAFFCFDQQARTRVCAQQYAIGWERARKFSERMRCGWLLLAAAGCR